MRSTDPPGAHDLGYRSGQEDDNWSTARRLQREIERMIPHRRFLVHPIPARIPEHRPVGYNAFQVEILRTDGESEDDLLVARRQLEQRLLTTNLELTQPGTGAPYLVFRDDDPVEPIYGPLGTNSQATVGWVFIVYLAPTLVSAEDIELTNERLRGRRRAG